MEDVAEYRGSLIAVFGGAREHSLTIITSELTLAETLVSSIRTGDIAKQKAYTEAIAAISNAIAVSVSRSIVSFQRPLKSGVVRI